MKNQNILKVIENIEKNHNLNLTWYKTLTQKKSFKQFKEYVFHVYIGLDERERRFAAVKELMEELDKMQDEIKNKNATSIYENQ